MHGNEIDDKVAKVRYELQYMDDSPECPPLRIRVSQGHSYDQRKAFVAPMEIWRKKTCVFLKTGDCPEIHHICPTRQIDSIMKLGLVLGFPNTAKKSQHSDRSGIYFSACTLEEHDNWNEYQRKELDKMEFPPVQPSPTLWNSKQPKFVREPYQHAPRADHSQCTIDLDLAIQHGCMFIQTPSRAIIEITGKGIPTFCFKRVIDLEKNTVIMWSTSAKKFLKSKPSSSSSCSCTPR